MTGALTVLAVLLLLFLCVGCLSPQQQDWTCERAQNALAAYQTAEDAGLVTDPKVIAAARIGASFLSSYCGWQTPQARPLPDGSRFPPPVDRNGVLIVHPPIIPP